MSIELVHELVHTETAIFDDKIVDVNVHNKKQLFSLSNVM